MEVKYGTSYNAYLVKGENATAVIESVKITYEATDFFTFLMMILLIFIGAGLCLRILLGVNKEGKE